MNDRVKEFVLDYIQRDYTIDSSDTDIMNLNYVEAGYVDSVAMVSFIYSIEAEFGIRLTNDDLTNPDFKIVGKLIDLISRKIDGK
jgi:acyl carrier protein